MDEPKIEIVDYSDKIEKLTAKFLKEATRLYGPASDYYEFRGIEYTTDNYPYVSYPANLDPPFNPIMIICLQEQVKSNFKEGVFQLSHEVIHLLSPEATNVTNNLEEGLAVYFSEVTLKSETEDEEYFDKVEKPPRYLKAYQLVKKLLDTDAEAIIKVRKEQPEFLKITKDDFKNAKIDISDEFIDQLLDMCVDKETTDTDVIVEE